MLSSTLLSLLASIIALSALVLAIFSVIRSLRAAEYASAAVGYVEKQSKRSVSLRKLAEIETELTDLTDSYAALIASHKKLRARIGMRAAREKSPNGADLSTGPLSDAQKTELKKELRLKHLKR